MKYYKIVIISLILCMGTGFFIGSLILKDIFITLISVMMAGIFILLMELTKYYIVGGEE